MKSRFTLENKTYVFMTAVVLFAAFGVALLSYLINSSQSERFDKQITMDAANSKVISASPCA